MGDFVMYVQYRTYIGLKLLVDTWRKYHGPLRGERMALREAVTMAGLDRYRVRAGAADDRGPDEKRSTFLLAIYTHSKEWRTLEGYPG